MLDLSTVDLGMLAIALADHSSEGSWWIDAETGEFVLAGRRGDEHRFDPEKRDDARCIDPLASSDGYGDMEDFIARVPDRRVAALLERAIAGRGAFRRFKDTLFEFPELRELWFRFSDVRMERRAIEFLTHEGLVEGAEARRALAERDDPPVGRLPAAPTTPVTWRRPWRPTCIGSMASGWSMLCCMARERAAMPIRTPTWTWP